MSYGNGYARYPEEMGRGGCEATYFSLLLQIECIDLFQLAFLRRGKQLLLVVHGIRIRQISGIPVGRRTWPC